MRILVTGISGFVGRHFVELLSSLNQDIEITGIYNKHLPTFLASEFPGIKCTFIQADMEDELKLKEIIGSFRPGFILHLASASSVGYSWQFPSETIKLNTGIFLNLLETIRSVHPACRLISVGSAEEYGSVNVKDIPLKEHLCPNPASPYGVSRMMQQKLVEIYSKNYGLDIIHTRSFNHIGPWQRANFVVSSFARQIAVQLKQADEVHIKVGNMEVTRDFTDVRDVVKSYLLLMQKGRPGNIYNVCSGKGTILKDLVNKFSVITGRNIRWTSEQVNLRPFENVQMIGSYEKINNETGWKPEIPIEKSLADLLGYWKENI